MRADPRLLANLEHNLGLGAITKPVLPLATTIGWVFGARFVDRIGKGIRGASRLIPWEPFSGLCSR